MKKVFLTLAFLLTTVVASAQFYVGGGLGVNFEKFDEAKTTSFDINPEVGYKFNDNFTVGAVLGFNYVKPDEGDAATTISIEPYARYTFLRAGGFSAFVDGVVGFEKGEEENAWNVGIKPGVAYNINDSWCVAARLGHIGYKSYMDSEIDKLGVELGNAVSFGVYYNF